MSFSQQQSDYSSLCRICTENTLIARHQRLLSRDQVSYDWQPTIPLIERKPGALRNGAPFAELPLLFAQLQTALRHRERQQGDRIMAKVLARADSRFRDGFTGGQTGPGFRGNPYRTGAQRTVSAE